jgi:hypothetical protein
VEDTAVPGSSAELENLRYPIGRFASASSLTPEQRHALIDDIAVTTLQLYAWHGRHHLAHIDRLRERMGW